MLHIFPMERGSDENENGLMQHYVSVCNRALDLNKERFPFKQIFEVVQQENIARSVNVIVDGGVHMEAYSICFSPEGVTLSDDVQLGSGNSKNWVINSEYLKAVSSDAEGYVQNPAKLDWGWLYDF